MDNREAIEILSRPFSMQEAPKEILDAHRLAISALEKQSRIITVTDAEGGLIASISDKDIIEENGVHVIISEE